LISEVHLFALSSVLRLRGDLLLQFVNLMALMAAWVYIFDTIQKEREALEMPERDVYAEAEAGQRPGEVSLHCMCALEVKAQQRLRMTISRAVLRWLHLGKLLRPQIACRSAGTQLHCMPALCSNTKSELTSLVYNVLTGSRAAA
jgi:hypothetical protein